MSAVERVRHSDWPRRLSALIRERRSLPYAYGHNDCFWFIHAAILGMTGADILPGVDRPASRYAAARFLVAGGYGDLEGLVTALLGPPLPTPKCAGRGDIVSFEHGGERHLGLVTGTGAATPGRDGLLWVPRVLWRTGWQV